MERRKREEEPVATIRASCPTCGDVELTSGDVTVLVCSTTSVSSYAFQCPTCDGAVTKPAEPRVVDLLVSTGVKLSVWQLPAEMEEVHSGPPIAYDDLLEFHFELRRDDWFDRVLALEKKDSV